MKNKRIMNEGKNEITIEDFVNDEVSKVIFDPITELLKIDLSKDEKERTLVRV